MSRRRRGWPLKLVALLLVAGPLLAAFWLGLVPPRFSPLAPLQLDEPAHWFLDFRLAAIKRDETLCRAALASPVVAARPIGDKEIVDGCGWRNAVAVSRAGGARLAAAQVTCEMAAALALWLEHDVQPLAERLLGTRVASVDSMGTYACRNIIGSRALTAFRSQHATANAIDISGFRLADGQSIVIARDWRSVTRKSEFLRAIHAKACGYFRVALSPDYNEAHRDHFHLDRSIMWRCR